MRRAKEPKKIRSLKMPYDCQLDIYRTCQAYPRLEAIKREKIEKLCNEVVQGDKNDFRALFAVLTTKKSIRRIAIECYMSERKLYYLRQKFYERW